MPKVTVNGQVFNFPDTMSQDEMGAAIQLHLKQQPPTLSNSEPVVENPVVNTGNPDASRVGFAIDQMQNMAGKGVEAFGRATGFEGVENYGTSVVEKNKQQIEDRNYQSTMPGSFLDQDGAKDKFLWTTEKIIENAGTAAVGLGGAAATAVAAFFGAPIAVTAGITGLAVGSSALLGTGEVAGEIEEKTGSYDPRIALGGGFVIGLLDRLGATRLIPKDQLMKMTGKEIVDELVKRGAGGMAAEFTTQVVKKAGAEGLTEVGQEAISMGASAYSGGDYTAGEVGNRLVDAAAIGTGQGGAVSTVIDGSTAVRSIFKAPGVFEDMREMSDGQRRAAGDVARDLEAVAKAEGFNLKKLNTNSEKGAKPALEKVYRRNSKLIKNLAKALKDRLKTTNATSLQELIDVYSVADGAIDDGKNKVSGYVSSSDLKAIQKLVGGTQEGAELMNALRKSNVITDLFKDGMKGGVSQFTDYFSPLGTTGAVYDASRLGNLVIGGALGTSAAVATGGTSLIPQGGVVVLGRLIDATTGRRAKLERFVKKNRKAPGLPAPEGLSVLEQAQEETKRQEQSDLDAKVRRTALAKIATEINAPDGVGPVLNILQGTGLDRNGLSEIITDMSKTYADDPLTIAVLESIQQNMAGDTNAVLELNEIIPIIGTIAATTKPNLVVRAPDNPLIADLLNSGAAPNVSTAAPGPLQGGNVATTPENYQAGKEANQQAARDLADGVVADTTIEQDQKELIFGALQIPANETVSIMDLRLKAGELELQGVSKENINKYFQPYIERMERQAKRRTVLQKAQPQSDDARTVGITPPKIERPVALGPQIITVEGQVPSNDQQTAHGLLPHLRVKAPAREGKSAILAKTNNKNANAQLNGLDEALERHPDPAASPEAWAEYQGDALATSDVPVQPHGFINDITKGGAQELLSKLTPGQIADADFGFENAAIFRQDYINGDISVANTGKLFLWSFLSKGVSPYAQESLFLDSFNGIDQWIEAASNGTIESRMEEYKAWAATTAPKGSGKPGAGAIHNLNAFGKDFLVKMAKPVSKDEPRSRLQYIHDLMSDPDMTGQQIRREFVKLGEGVGIDNKVVSFTLLVAGFDDVMVLDRVQMRQLYNDGRFDGINLYDGYKQQDPVDGKSKVVTGSTMAPLTNGVRGLMMYEALEKSLGQRIQQIYSDVGRPQSASIGRYHWDTWVASSEQEASHGSIDAILAQASGDPNPLEGVTAKEGEYGAYAYGAQYGLENGAPMFTYEVPDRGTYKFTVPEFTSFLNDIKRKAKSNKVIPSGFSVKQSGNAPWYTREGVDLDALAEKANEYGQQVRGEDGGIRQDQAVPDGRTVDAVGDSSSVPALRIPDRNTIPQAPRRSPFSRVTAAEVKPFRSIAKVPFEIGKEGSQDQDGIQDMDRALDLAHALGMTVRLFDNQTDLLGASMSGDAGLRGRFTRSMTKGAEGTVFGLVPDSKLEDGNTVPGIEALVTLLHEISHGMTMSPQDLSSPQLKNDEFYNSKTREYDYAPKGSFANSAIRPLLEGTGDADILAEIDNLQENIDAYTTKDPKQRIAIRQFREIAAKIKPYVDSQNIKYREARLRMDTDEMAFLESQMKDLDRQADGINSYIKNTREMAVDPNWVYLLNPKLLKAVAPKTAKLLKDFYRQGGNKTIQFYSQPFAVIAAVVMAMLAKGQAEEEQEKQQMQMAMSGALSNQPPPPGILSAA